MKTEIKTIVFDLGGVLIDWNPRYLFRKHFGGDDARMETFLREVCNQHWNEKQDAGRPFAEAMAEVAERHPEWREMIHLYFAKWPEMLGGPIQGTVDIMSRLRGDGWPLYALTNWSAETFPYALKRFDFLHWFNGIVVSGAEKMLKPEARFFKLLIDRHGLEAGSSLFIDDVQANVDGARAAGLQAVRFTNPQTLSEDLRRFGIF